MSENKSTEWIYAANSEPMFAVASLLGPIHIGSNIGGAEQARMENIERHVLRIQAALDRAGIAYKDLPL